MNTVRKWRGRFAECGLAGLRDLPRSGRPRVISEADRAAVVRAVGQQVGHAQLAANRGNGHDPAVPLLAHQRQGGQRQPGRSQRHGGQRGLHLLGGIHLDRADLDDPGIAEDDVEAAVALECDVHQPLRGCVLGHVEDDRGHLGTGSAQLTRGPFQLGRIARAENKGTAVPGQLAGQQQAEAAGRAGDHGDLAANVVFHGRPAARF